MNLAKWELVLDGTLSLPAVPELEQRLREKLEEYRKRIADYKEAYRSRKLGIVLDRNSNLLDALYKSEIVEALLEEGRIDVRRIHDRLSDEFDGYISEDVFTNAVSVINDYIRTGGIHTEGGSGFFTDEMFKELLETAEALEYPEDAGQRAAIQNKYYEYLGRKVDYEERGETTVDRPALRRNIYKIRILAELKEHRRVFVADLAAALAREEGKIFDKVEFYNAMCSIRELLNRITK